MIDMDIPPVVPRITILGGQDLAVAAWTWETFKKRPMMIYSAFGIADEGSLVGSVIFSEFNGFSVEFGYYGHDVLTANVVRFMARYALVMLEVERVTVRIPKSHRRMGRQLRRRGAQVEGVLKYFYGRTLANEHTAVQYALFKDELIRLAGPRYRNRKMH